MFIHCGYVQWHTHFGKLLVSKNKKLNIALIWLSIPLPHMYPRETKSYVHPNRCTQTFTAVLFLRVKRWKQPKCLLTDEWINKMWYIHTMDYYSAIKRNEVLFHTITWMNWKHYAKWKKPDTEDHILYDFIFMKCPE